MIAEVAVFGFTVKPNTYTYLIPPSLTKVSPGSVVEIPFGKETRTGIVVNISNEAPTRPLKELKSVNAAVAQVTPHQLSLAEWIAEFYFVSLAEALQLMIPHLPKTPTLIDQSIKQSVKQELLLFPTFLQAKTAQKKGGGVLFSHALPSKDLGVAWSEIASGQARVVVGTRSALFAPFRNLTRISIFQPESDLYKDERRPYYRTIEVAAALGQIWKVKITPVSYSPRAQDQYRWPHVIRKLADPFHYEVVNLRQEEVISSELLNRLKTGPARQLVFLNRKSEKGPLVCRTCKVRSYVSDPSVCPNCGSANVRFQLFNLATLEKKIRSRINTNAQFATQQIFFQESPRFDQIVVLSADTYISQANYDSSEKTYQLITQLIRLLKPGGQIIVQTAYPQESSVISALKNDYGAFYATEIEARKETMYPPFTRLAKLTYSGSLVPTDPSIPVGLESFGPFGEGKKHPYWIVRGPDLSDLKYLPRPWKIDLDPLYL